MQFSVKRRWKKVDVKNDEIKKKKKKKRSLEKDTRGMRSLTQLTGWILHETRVLQPVQINQSFSMRQPARV